MTLIRLHEKEGETVNWIKENIKEEDVFYDIGACIGTYSILAANQGAKVFSFEPSFLNYSSLAKNIYLNKKTDSINIFPIGLGDVTSVQRITLSSMRAGAANHKISEKGDMSILSYRLDDFVKAFNLPSPKFVKIDTDGYEANVIKGGSETLKQAQSVIIEIDERNESFRDLLDYFVHSDFKIAGKFQRGEKPVYNYIFIK